MIVRNWNGRKVYADAPLEIMSASMRIKDGNSTGKVKALTVKLGSTGDFPIALEVRITVEELRAMNDWVTGVEHRAAKPEGGSRG